MSKRPSPYTNRPKQGTLFIYKESNCSAGKGIGPKKRWGVYTPPLLFFGYFLLWLSSYSSFYCVILGK